MLHLVAMASSLEVSSSRCFSKIVRLRVQFGAVDLNDMTCMPQITTCALLKFQ